MQLRLAAAVAGLILLVLFTIVWRPPQADSQLEPPAEVVEDAGPELFIAPPPEDLAAPGVVRKTDRLVQPAGGSTFSPDVVLPPPVFPPPQAGSAVQPRPNPKPARVPKTRPPSPLEAGSVLRGRPTATPPAIPRIPAGGSVVGQADVLPAMPRTVVLDAGIRMPEQPATTLARCVEFSPDGSQVAVGDSEGKIRLLDVETRRLLRTIDLGTSVLFEMVYTPDGSLLTSDSQDRLRLFDTVTGKSVRSYRPRGPIKLMKVAPGGEHLIAGCDSGHVIRVSLTSGEPLELGRHSSAVSAVTISQDGHYTATAGTDRTVWVWSIDSPGSAHSSKSLMIAPTCLAFSPDGRCLLGAGSQSPMTVWKYDPETGLALAHNIVALSGANTILFDGSTALTIGFRRSALLLSRIELNGRQVTPRLQSLAGGTIRDTAIAPDNRTLAALTQDGAVHLLQLNAAAMTVVPIATIPPDQSPP
jgi:hypothetical protein